LKNSIEKKIERKNYFQRTLFSWGKNEKMKRLAVIQKSVTRSTLEVHYTKISNLAAVKTK